MEDLGLQDELAGVLRFTSKVAAAIRRVSAAKHDSSSAQHLTQLANLLGSLNYLGQTLQEGTAAEVSWACDFLAKTYRDNQRGHESIYAQYRDLFATGEAVEIFESIRTKLACRVSATGLQ